MKKPLENIQVVGLRSRNTQRNIEVETENSLKETKKEEKRETYHPKQGQILQAGEK